MARREIGEVIRGEGFGEEYIQVKQGEDKAKSKKRKSS